MVRPRPWKSEPAGMAAHSAVMHRAGIHVTASHTRGVHGARAASTAATAQSVGAVVRIAPTASLPPGCKRPKRHRLGYIPSPSGSDGSVGLTRYKTSATRRFRPESEPECALDLNGTPAGVAKRQFSAAVEMWISLRFSTHLHIRPRSEQRRNPLLLPLWMP